MRVMRDVPLALFKQSLLEDVFKKQQTFTMSKMRVLFETLAHCSIMKLNETSMDKLFDLIVMGMKHQLLSCQYPSHLIAITMKHVMTMRTMTNGDDAFNATDNCINLVKKWLITQSECDAFNAYFAMCNFVQDKRIKVVVFMDHGWQHNDASFIMAPDTMLIPGGDNVVQMKFYNGRTNVICKDLTCAVAYNATVEQQSCFGYNVYLPTTKLNQNHKVEPMQQPPVKLPEPAAPKPSGGLAMLMHLVEKKDSELVSLFIGLDEIDINDDVPGPTTSAVRHCGGGDATVRYRGMHDIIDVMMYRCG